MAKVQDGHPTEEMFEKYSLGHLSASECEPFENHLLICSECQDHLAAIDAEIAGLKEVCKAAATAPASRSPRGLFAWLFAAPKPVWAAAAAALALAIALPVYHQAAAPRGETEVTITTSRGAAPATASTRAGASLKLNVEIQGVALEGTCRVDIVDSNGRTEWTGPGGAANGRVTASVAEGLRAGQHWVRVFNRSGQLLRESPLELTR